MQNNILTIKQMYQADAATISGGTPGSVLMENAGRGVVDIITTEIELCSVLVLCGPGNNGGDGFVVARLLKNAGYDVRLASLCALDKFQGDAAEKAAAWDGETEILSGDTALDGVGLVVDALFGVGLSKPLGGILPQILGKISEQSAHIKVVAVDIPSGIDGDHGTVDPACLAADITVTFAVKKPGHILLPGKSYCGDVHVIDIGITDDAVESTTPYLYENTPSFWRDNLPKLNDKAHKYTRGHAVVLGGQKMTGAACLASQAASRMGAGLVSILSAPKTVPIYAGYMAHFLVEPVESNDDCRSYLQDPRRNVVLLGPGAGATDALKDLVLSVLEMKDKCVVLDADALTVFKDAPDQLFEKLHDRCVLTPHEGEFTRLFGASNQSKIDRTIAAAKRAGATILLKGGDSVIASPDGRAVINSNAPPTLATAGSGDVLAGIITGLIAQDMPVFDSVCASVWIHGAAAQSFGPGLVAEDITDALPQILSDLY